MSNSRVDNQEDPNSLFNVVCRATKNMTPIEALSVFGTHMLRGGNVHDGLVSAAISASSAPLMGAMVKGLGEVTFFKNCFFKSTPPKSLLYSVGVLNVCSFVASQAMFNLYKMFIDASRSRLNFTIDHVAGLLAVSALISIYLDLSKKENLVDGSESSYIRKLGGS